MRLVAFIFLIETTTLVALDAGSVDETGGTAPVVKFQLSLAASGASDLLVTAVVIVAVYSVS